MVPTEPRPAAAPPKVKPSGGTPVKPSAIQPDRAPTDPSDYAKIYVGNLDYSVTEQQLRAFFAAFGEVSDAHIPIDFHTKTSRGFGFVEFEQDAVAKKILADKQPKYLAGRRLYIQGYKKQ